MEAGHGFSVEDENGQKRQAFVDELTQPQFDFIFYAKEERKRMRQDNSGGNSTGNNTTHIT